MTHLRKIRRTTTLPSSSASASQKIAPVKIGNLTERERIEGAATRRAPSVLARHCLRPAVTGPSSGPST